MESNNNIDMEGLCAVANSIRSLSIDAIQKAKSGHPGMVLGAAELAAVLYGEALKHNPANPSWINRDRFILSAGHGSMLLYSILHLAGYPVSLDDIKSFRQVGSICPGHPEHGVTPGVECTTGPLGQGVSIAVGMAVSEEMAASHFNREGFSIVDHYIYSLVGEGCLEEGVSSEAASIAGCLKLGRLIVFYDENRVSIDGPTDITFNEDIKKRYESYGWQVLNGSMYNMLQMMELIEEAKSSTDRPTLIILSSTIGNMSPLAGSCDCHGTPLGAENVALTKKNMGIPLDSSFYIIPKAHEYFSIKASKFKKDEADWNNLFDLWSAKYPQLRREWDEYIKSNATDGSAPVISLLDTPLDLDKKMATRSASGSILNNLFKKLPNLTGGSADLTGPNKTKLSNAEIFSATNRTGRYIEFGIREFAMSALCSGIALHGFFRPFCATFLVFADYLRAQLRLSSLMDLPIIYIFTHDSIFVGEDGPTHQSVETLASLRAIPGVVVLRPADSAETVLAWEIAANTHDHPVCIVLTRQDIAPFKKHDDTWRESIKARGAYVARFGGDRPDITILATGSEVTMALDAVNLYEEKNPTSAKSIRVVSILDFKKFDNITSEERNKVLLGGAKRVIACEAGVSDNWKEFVSDRKDLFCIDRFGLSGPGGAVAKTLGFTADDLSKLF